MHLFQEFDTDNDGILVSASTLCLFMKCILLQEEIILVRCLKRWIQNTHCNATGCRNLGADDLRV